MIKAIKNIIKNAVTDVDFDPFTLHNRDYHLAIQNPLFRESLRDLSIEEDKINSYYTGILNIISQSCVGTVPHILGQSDDDQTNNYLEDRWLDWCLNHQIGAALRELRRDAAKTGLGVMVSYFKKNTDYPVQLAYKNIPITQLQTPLDRVGDPRVIDGVEYDSNWDIIKVHVQDGTDGSVKSYKVPEQAIVWKIPTAEIVPECGPAFCLFPSVRRVLKAIVRGEELNVSIPMAVKLDPQVYKVEDALEHPTGQFEYEPGMIPTLPPGADLSGLNIRPQNDERVKFVELVITAAGRCKNMPKNIILGDSSNHNMASAQVDLEPWKNTVDVDRHDFEPAVRQTFAAWMKVARITNGYFPRSLKIDDFTYALNHKRLFSHPDPNKKANARMTDLLSGSTTLYRIFTEEGLNPRRELERERQLLGLEREQLISIILAGRTKEALQVLQMLPETKDGQGN